MNEYSRVPGVTETAVDAEIFLVDPVSQEVFYLDETGAALWRLLAAPQSFGRLLAVFRAAFPDIAEDRIAVDLQKALDRLVQSGLVQLASAPAGEEENASS